ncbi:MAG: 50S ribosomal protein L32 [Verrucomicrobia bacterium]|nr:50S ribosomal protein L32 [Verrucomicrobiota bacterium]MBU6446880.1 50S ribosomal protein L32 [Verrucomicrobiota bacterium]MDE3046959.1 50S ribosomal protein L32 [Verrucomicrobiota bacterium]
MAVPRNRTSNAKKNSRRSHHAKKPKNFSNCPNCGKARLPHRICPSCGQYKGQAFVASA